MARQWWRRTCQRRHALAMMLPVSSRARAGGIVWQRSERRLPLRFEVLHGVKEGSEVRVMIRLCVRLCRLT